MFKLVFYLIIFLLCLKPEPGSAQKNYFVQHYTGDNGLPQNSIKGIAADTEGFVWMATEDGLVRYDGRNFYVFNSFNLPVKWNRVNNFKPMLGKTYANDANKPFYAHFYNDESVRIENGKAIPDSSFSSKQFKLRKAFGQLEALYLTLGLPDPLLRMKDSGSYMLPAGDGEGDFFVCTYKDVRYYSDFKEKYNVDFATTGRDFFTLGKQLYYMYEDVSFKRISDGKLAEIELAGDLLRDKNYSNRKGNVKIYWNMVSGQTFLYLNKNLYSLEIEKSERGQNSRFFTRLIVEGFDLITKGIEEIYYDKSIEKVYLGSGTDGLYVLTKQHFQALTTNGDYLENVMYAQLPFGIDAVMATSGIILGKDAITGQIFQKQNNALIKAKNGNKRILIKDNYGTVWVSEGKKLFSLPISGKKVRERWIFPTVIDAMSDVISDYLWLGTGKGGLYRLNVRDKKAVPELYLENPSLGFSYLQFWGPDKMLIGTWNGLHLLDIATKKMTFIKDTEGSAIKSLHVIDSETLWITGLGKGLMRLDKSGKIVSFPLDKNNYLANPHCVIDDGRGFIWIPTNNGLFQMSLDDLNQYSALETKPKDLFYQYHNKDEGFNTNEFNGNCIPCGLKLANGYISLPSLSGFVWFRPENIRRQDFDGAIVLDNVNVGQNTLMPFRDTLYFPLNPERVKLNFSTAYFGNSYNLRISYALVKQYENVASDDWIPIDDDHLKIEFSNLKSGNYTLLIRKLNGFGIDNYTVKKIYFVVPLFWYQTWWAYGMLTVLFLAIVYFYIVWRVRNVKRENLRLEGIIAKRTSKLNETLKDLEKSKSDATRQVHMLSRLLTSMTHDIQSPLNFIKLTSGNIPKMIAGGEFDDVSEVGKMISDSSGQMSNLLRGLLDYIKVHVFENTLHFENIDLKLLVDEKHGIFKNMIIQNGSEFLNEVPEDLQVLCDYQMLAIMIHNLIDNAAKYTRKGLIHIYTEVDPSGKITLVVSNTALGISDQFLEMINQKEEAQTLTKPQAPVRKTSMGLLIVKEIAALVGVELKVTQNGNTRFYMSFADGVVGEDYKTEE